MTLVKEQIALKDYTTFGIGGLAAFFAEVKSESELRSALDFVREKRIPVFVLGGGSNILISDRGFDGLVVRPTNFGFETIEENDEGVIVSIAAGENWDEIVGKIVEQGLWGVENLSYIPGSVGAAPVQNIGAYGQELSETLEFVEAFDRTEKKFIKIANNDCGFSYRMSRFKGEDKGRFIIWRVALRLRKNGAPNRSYAEVQKYFAQQGIRPGLPQMRAAVTAIRKNKLPDPAKVGNAGSFFKNSHLTEDEFGGLREKLAENFDAAAVAKLDGYKERFASGNTIKVPSGFLVELCGLKGKSLDGAKVSDKQALVITNASGKAGATHVLELVRLIQSTVYDKTGVKISPEPELVGFSPEDLNGII